MLEMTDNGRYARIDHLREELCKAVASALPHGSGFDVDWTVEDRPQKDEWVASGSFHVMNEDGYYVGWVDLDVYIPKTDPTEFRLVVRGERSHQLVRRFMLRDYFEDTIVWSLDDNLDREIKAALKRVAEM